MINKNKIFYIKNILIDGKEISEENQIFIKCETWQWGRVDSTSNITGDEEAHDDPLFSAYELPEAVHINKSIYVFNRTGCFGIMKPVDSEKQGVNVEIELAELTSTKDGDELNINPKEKDLSASTIKCTFQDLLDNNFMIIDHFVMQQTIGESLTGYLGEKNPFSNEGEQTNLKLLQGIDKPEGPVNSFHYFGQSPIAFPPDYQEMSSFEEKILNGAFDGNKIFRWFGRTEASIYKISCSNEKSLFFKRYIEMIDHPFGAYPAHKSVLNDYEKSIIF